MNQSALNPSSATAGELALVLSPEQFLILADALGEPVPPYIAAPLAEEPRSRRAASLAAAWQSLVARQVVIEGDHIRVPVTAARLVQVACRPALSVVVHRCAGGVWSPAVTRLAAVPGTAVEVHPDGGALRLTPLHTDLLLSRTFLRCGIASAAAPRVPAVTVPLSLLRAAAGGGDSAARILADGGVGVATAESVGAALAQGERFAVSAQLRAGAGRRTGGELAWLVGADGYWLWPPALTPLSGGDDTVDEVDVSFRLLPARGDDLRDALASTTFSIDS